MMKLQVKTYDTFGGNYAISMHQYHYDEHALSSMSSTLQAIENLSSHKKLHSYMHGSNRKQPYAGWFSKYLLQIVLQNIV